MIHRTEIYVPPAGDRGPEPRETATRWPPSVYVPGPGPGEDGDGTDGLEARLRAHLPDGAGSGGPAALARALPSVFREPELVRELLDRLAAELRAREADTVAALEPGGQLLGAALAARTGRPLVTIDVPGASGEPPAGVGKGGEAPPARVHGSLETDARALLVTGVLASGDRLGQAAGRLEAAEARIAGIATLIELAGAGGREAMEDHNLLCILTLDDST